MATRSPDLLLINPGGRQRIYQDLGSELTAVEPPLWCRLIGGYVHDRGFSVEILDAEALDLGPAGIANFVSDLRPRLVGVIVYAHQPSSSTQQMVSAGETCRAIKEESPDTPVLIAGGHVSALPQRTLGEEVADYACKGEGPATVVGLLQALGDGGTDNLARVPGLVWRCDGRPVVNPSAPLIQDLDDALHGNAWDLLPMDRYRAHNWHCFGALETRTPYASIYTSLGCPYTCAFCCINAPFEANRYRMRSPAAVVREIDRLCNDHGVRTLKITDEMFVLNERHVLSICDLLIERDYGLNIWAYARVDTVKPRMLDKLRRAGIRWLALGIESGSAHVRDGAEKTFKENDILHIVRDIQQAGIHVTGNFIFGLPDDTQVTMKQTLDLAIELNCEYANFYSAMAYPGSALYTRAVAKGLPLPERWTGYSQHSYDCRPLPTDHLTAAEVLQFRDDAFHAYFSNPRYLDMVGRTFGPATRRHVEDMASLRLRRRLLEERDAAE
jgi:radical SAM superfamily enzyme YgiQ (UPF0313 family)